jgi:hypothetical protein
MGAEDERHLSEQGAQASQQDQGFSRFRGDRFNVIIHEEMRNGETHLTIGVSDDREIVVFRVTDTVREHSTRFFPADEIAQSGLSQSFTEPVTRKAAPKKPGQPTKIEGTIIAVEEMRKTKKQGRAMLPITVFDTNNQVERRTFAFDTIALALATPETNLQPGEPITLFAHKHENPLHMRGKQVKTEDWYIQSAYYHEKRFEKPKNNRQRGQQSSS